jgi:hypothetical protein
MGGIIMLAGIGITSSFISAVASGWAKSGIKGNTPKDSDPKETLRIRLAKGEITKDLFGSAKIDI